MSNIPAYYDCKEVPTVNVPEGESGNWDDKSEYVGVI